MGGRDIVRQVTPPFVADAWRRRQRAPSAWEYRGEEWIDERGPGWNAEGVVEAYVRKLPEFRRAIAAPESIGVPTEAVAGVGASQYHQNVALELAYAVATASDRESTVSILDWGGGFGFSCFVVQELFPQLEIDFHVKDVPVVVGAARPLVPEVTFWDDDGCLDRAYDLAVASSSLQYAPDWRAQLGRLHDAARFVLLTRTPVTSASRSFVVRQRAYDTSYNGWIISRRELVETARTHGLELVREFLEGWSTEITGAPAPHEHRGFLFRKLG